MQATEGARSKGLYNIAYIFDISARARYRTPRSARARNSHVFLSRRLIRGLLNAPSRGRPRTGSNTGTVVAFDWSFVPKIR